MFAFLKSNPFSKISLKRKAGGTMVGNLLRKLVHKQTDGAFGNGAMLQGNNETNRDFNDRMMKSVGAAAMAFSDTAGHGEMADVPENHNVSAFKSGAILQKLKHFSFLLIPVAIIIGVVAYFKKRK